jgi:hypothetical protein
MWGRCLLRPRAVRHVTDAGAGFNRTENRCSTCPALLFRGRREGGRLDIARGVTESFKAAQGDQATRSLDRGSAYRRACSLRASWTPPTRQWPSAPDELRTVGGRHHSGFLARGLLDRRLALELPYLLPSCRRRPLTAGVLAHTPPRRDRGIGAEQPLRAQVVRHQLDHP